MSIDDLGTSVRCLAPPNGSPFPDATRHQLDGGSSFRPRAAHRCMSFRPAYLAASAPAHELWCCRRQKYSTRRPWCHSNRCATDPRLLLGFTKSFMRSSAVFPCRRSNRRRRICRSARRKALVTFKPNAAKPKTRRRADFAWRG